MTNTVDNTGMDIHEILEHLPHRYPFVLVDRVVSLELGKEIVAIKNVSVNSQATFHIIQSCQVY